MPASTSNEKGQAVAFAKASRSALSLSFIVEASPCAAPLAYAVRDAWLADPATSDVKVDDLLADTLLDQLAARVDLSRDMPGLPSFGGVEHRDTVYITVVDEQRNAVSVINSLPCAGHSESGRTGPS